MGCVTQTKECRYCSGSATCLWIWFVSRRLTLLLVQSVSPGSPHMAFCFCLPRGLLTLLEWQFSLGQLLTWSALFLIPVAALSWGTLSIMASPLVWPASTPPTGILTGTNFLIFVSTKLILPLPLSCVVILTLFSIGLWIGVVLMPQTALARAP